MHRSGTSLLTRIINLLGAGVPANLIPATSDNPNGYWESEPIMKFNIELMVESGNSWKTCGSISDSFFNYLKAERYQDKARTILRQEFGETPLIVIKCPRICRLFPFWENVLIEAGYEIYPILMVREPREVYQSLAARALTPKVRGGKIVQEEHAALLWLRYILDSERYTRHKQRYVIQYTELIRDWYFALNGLTSFFNLSLTIHSEAIRTEVNNLLRPEMRRQKAPDEDKLITNYDVFTQVEEVYRMFNNTGNLSLEKLDYLTHHLNTLFEEKIASELNEENHAQILKQRFDYLNDALKRW